MPRKKSNIPTGVIVALITAGLTCIGTSVAAIIGYMGMRAQAEIPLKATQTAEAVASPKPNQEELKATFELGLSYGCFVGPYKVLPIEINPSLNASLATDKITQSISNKELFSWNLGPTTAFPITLRNISTNNNWVTLNNNFKIRVYPINASLQDNYDVVTSDGGCGGGVYRELPPFSLEYQTDKFYEQTLKSTQYDYFSLQPGEFEIFILGFSVTTQPIWGSNKRLV